MARDPLLNDIISLSHTARFRRLRDAGREALAIPKVAAILNEWEHGDWQERLYCVQSCSGSGDTARLHRMTNDPSRSVSNQALSLLVDHGSDEILVDVLAKSTHRRRKRLLARLSSRRRVAAIDDFLTKGFAERFPRISELLPYGSAQAVNRHLFMANECGGSFFWERLARHHPQIAVKAILDKLFGVEQPDGLTLQYARSVVMFAGKAEPDLTVQLVKLLAQFMPPAHLDVANTLYRRPNELATIVLESEDSAPFSLAPVARKIDVSLLRKILQERPAALPFRANWFRQIPSAVRATIFQEVGRSWRDAEGLLPGDVLALLPNQERVVEAERIAALPIMTTRPQTQATYAAYLPWVKMREIIDRFLTHPEGESRAWGWASVLMSLRFHRDQAANVLAMIRKRKFEQDPVRLSILQSLADLPQGLWKAEHLVEIAGVVREALDATDLSYTSAMFLTAFVQKLIPTHPDWAAKQLVTIYAERGNIGGYYLETRINNEQALTLEDAFVNVGKSWGRGNRVGWLVWFASALGKRLRVCARLLKILEELLGKESGTYDALILQILREQLPYAEFERLTKHLITAHESWVALSPIYVFLHQHRQDWLEPFLSKSKFRMKGGSTVELVNLLQPNGYHRYTLGQQTALAITLNDIIRLPNDDRLPNDVWTMLRAMNFLAVLPAVDPSRLIELSKDTRPVIVDAAIRGLGRLDSGQGLPTLIASLGDNRARLAIYALRQAMAELPAEVVVAHFRNAPMEKVTVAKEMIRLVGEFGGSAGFDWLLAVSKQDLHRDVRIAVLRGFWDHLERPEAWTILTEAAENPDGRTLNGVVRIPADRLSGDSRRRLIDLLAGLANHSDAIIRLTVLRRFIEMPLPDGEGRLIQTALRYLTAASSDEREAVAMVIAANSTASDAARIADAIGRIRDQRRPLHDFVAFITAAALANASCRRRLEPMARAVLETLRVDPITAGLRLKLAAGVLGAEGFERELRELIDQAFMISAIIQDGTLAIEQIGQTTNRNKLSPLEARLASSDDPHQRLLAFIALVAQSHDPTGWDDSRRDRLTDYRNDPAPLVAIRAQYYFDADEPQ